MFGRIFLLLILTGVGVVGYRVLGMFGQEEEKKPVPELVQGKEEKPVVRPAEAVEIVQDEEEPEQIVILAWAKNFVAVEGWGIVELGQEMPCGGTLRRIGRQVVVVLENGKERLVKAANTAKLMAERGAAMSAQVLGTAPLSGPQMPSPIPAFGGLFGGSENSDN